MTDKNKLARQIFKQMIIMDYPLSVRNRKGRPERMAKKAFDLAEAFRKEEEKRNPHKDPF